MTTDQQIEQNGLWAQRLITRFDPAFQYRWELTEKLLHDSLQKQYTWLDLGCGENRLVRKYGDKVRFALGLDYLVPETKDTPFIRGSAYQLPFKSESFDYINLEFVAEHLHDITAFGDEIFRVLKPDGVLQIETTNLMSPFILLPRLIPYSLKTYHSCPKQDLK